MILSNQITSQKKKIKIIFDLFFIFQLKSFLIFLNRSHSLRIPQVIIVRHFFGQGTKVAHLFVCTLLGLNQAKKKG